MKHITDPYTPINDRKADTDHQRIFTRDSNSTRIQKNQSYFAKTQFNYNHTDQVILKVDVNNKK